VEGKELTTMSNLTPAEEKVLYLMRDLGEYEKIVITKQDEKIAIVMSSTVKEIFPK